MRLLLFNITSGKGSSSVSRPGISDEKSDGRSDGRSDGAVGLCGKLSATTKPGIELERFMAKSRLLDDGKPSDSSWKFGEFGEFGEVSVPKVSILAGGVNVR